MKRIPRVAGLITAATAVAAVSAAVLVPSASARTAAPATHSAAHSAALTAAGTGPKPTIVLVHGAWADASSWTPVIERLQQAGYQVDAPPNPLQGLSYDSAYIASYLKQITGPVILVGHSYGGAVITDAAVGDANVKALVYIAGWAPAKGESLLSLINSKLGQEIPALTLTSATYPLLGGGTAEQFTINPADYRAEFTDNELPAAEADALAAEQRPLSLNALSQDSGTPAWQTIPSWYMVADGDRAIAPNLERFMAARMHAHTVDVNGPHLLMLTDPGAVTRLIEEAATATTGS
ncbi:MAG TPA: alpha/beta hydrolase [Trebonia sp.]|nr:alpha/beta hydrolase [Trebonia sp.]